NEDYINVTFGVDTPGTWNDLPNEGCTGKYSPQGYIVEYGGMPGDPEVDISASTKITIFEIADSAPTLRVCDTIADGDDANGFTEFDLTQNESIILNGSLDRKSTRLNSSHVKISYAVFCLKKKKIMI